jgi:putative spermidine/putrescine transport system ATP-binding protein
MASSGQTLHLDQVSKRYGDSLAVDDVSLRVAPGTFLTLLGPSGSGKTTLLMMIAGFVAPSSGSLSMDATPIGHLPPERRQFGMVFQGYALFPHLSVAENVAFPLKVRRWSRAEIRQRVSEALESVQLSAMADRMPRQLSGGQRDPLLLARALVFHPHLLLLDEPLSALDKNLRTDMQSELSRLHRRIGLTFIYVTHDQQEALSMSDEIAILRDGRLVQHGTPQALYERPDSKFVAGFLGRSNFIEGVPAWPATALPIAAVARSSSRPDPRGHASATRCCWQSGRKKCGCCRLEKRRIIVSAARSVKPPIAAIFCPSLPMCPRSG